MFPNIKNLTVLILLLVFIYDTHVVFCFANHRHSFAVSQLNIIRASMHTIQGRRNEFQSGGGGQTYKNREKGLDSNLFTYAT